jgi:hypothetical protein
MPGTHPRTSLVPVETISGPKKHTPFDATAIPPRLLAPHRYQPVRRVLLGGQHNFIRPLFGKTPSPPQGGLHREVNHRGGSLDLKSVRILLGYIACDVDQVASVDGRVGRFVVATHPRPHTGDDGVMRLPPLVHVHHVLPVLQFSFHRSSQPFQRLRCRVEGRVLLIVSQRKAGDSNTMPLRHQPLSRRRRDLPVLPSNGRRWSRTTVPCETSGFRDRCGATATSSSRAEVGGPAPHPDVSGRTRFQRGLALMPVQLPTEGRRVERHAFAPTAFKAAAAPGCFTLQRNRRESNPLFSASTAPRPAIRPRFQKKRWAGAKSNRLKLIFNQPSVPVEYQPKVLARDPSGRLF